MRSPADCAQEAHKTLGVARNLEAPQVSGGLRNTLPHHITAVFSVVFALALCSLVRFCCSFATGEDGMHTQATYALYATPVSCLVAAAQNKDGTLHSFVHTLTEGGSRRLPVFLGPLLQAKLGSVLIIAGGAWAQTVPHHTLR